MSESCTYTVTIPYREPTYELRRGGAPPELYTTRYTVKASGPVEAVSKAVAEFNINAANSGVAWIREIEPDGIRVERIES